MPNSSCSEPSHAATETTPTTDRSGWLRAIRAAEWPASARVFRATARDLAELMTPDGVLSASNAAIASATGMPDRTVGYHKAQLVKTGWLVHVRRGGNGRKALYRASVPEVAGNRLPTVPQSCRQPATDKMAEVVGKLVAHSEEIWGAEGDHVAVASAGTAATSFVGGDANDDPLASRATKEHAAVEPAQPQTARARAREATPPPATRGEQRTEEATPPLPAADRDDSYDDADWLLDLLWPADLDIPECDSRTRRSLLERLARMCRYGWFDILNDLFLDPAFAGMLACVTDPAAVVLTRLERLERTGSVYPTKAA